jgi:peptide/nickel transport system substrate-binding protein
LRPVHRILLAPFRARFLALFVPLAACRGPGTPAGEIVVLNETPILRLDPRFASATWEQKVSQLVAPGLVGLQDRGIGPTPGLAASLTPLDDLTWEARLRPDARFPDGSPVTAEDVRYTFDSVRDARLGSFFRKTWEDILVRVDVVDPVTIRFILKRPRASFITDQVFGIVSRKHAEPRDRALFAALAAGQPPPPLDVVDEVRGAGPYRVASRGADFVTLERNPHALVAPALPRLTVRTIRDDNARVLALLGGSADAILNGVTPLVLETLEAEPGVVVQYAPSATLTYLGFNTRHALLKDRRVRQAIALAIDRTRLVEAKLRGRARVARSPLPEGNPYQSGDGRAWPHDPAMARRLLDEAGLPDPDGPGPRTRATLTWRTSNKRDRVAMAHAMARQLGEVGLDVEVRPFEFATFMEDVRKGNFDLFTMQFVDLVEPDVLRSLLHREKIPTPENNYGGLNRFRYDDPAMNQALDAGLAVAAPERRKPHYATVQRLLMEELPFLPLWHEDNVLVHRRTLRVPAPLPTAPLEGLLDATKSPRERP